MTTALEEIGISMRKGTERKEGTLLASPSLFSQVSASSFESQKASASGKERIDHRISWYNIHNGIRRTR